MHLSAQNIPTTWRQTGLAGKIVGMHPARTLAVGTVMALTAGACSPPAPSVGGSATGSASDGSTASPDSATGVIDGTTDSTADGTAGSGNTDPTAPTDPPGVECTQADAIALEDPVLDAIVRESLMLEPDDVITPPMAATLLEVWTDENDEVRSLNGLECFTGLESLVFRNDSFTDLSPVTGLPELRGLLVLGAPVASIPPLPPTLLYLRLVDSEVSDLSMLEGMGLTDLRVDGSPVTDLSVVASMGDLVLLHANRTGVSDLTPVAAAPSLRLVSFNDTAITDATPLASHATIEEVWLDGTSISDLSPLAAMPSLEQLFVSGTLVSDLSPMAAATALTDMAFSDTQVTDLAPLLSTSIEFIWLDRVPLADPLQLWTLPGLRGVSAAQVGLTSLDGAPDSLLRLHLAGNQLVDVSPIAGLPALERLDLADNAIVDLAPIQNAPVFGLVCNEFTITGNPLDANSIDTVIPAICDQDVVVVADANSCAQLRLCGPID